MTNLLKKLKPKLPVFVLILIIFCSCKKNISPGTNNNNGDLGSIPAMASTPVNANLMVYAYENDQSSNPMQISTYSGSNNSNLNYQGNFDGFLSDGPELLDKYQAHLTYRLTLTGADLGFPQYKPFDVADTNKNYVGVKFLNFTNTGLVQDLGSPVTLTMPGNGTLAFPTRVWSSPPTEMSYNVYVAYSAPFIKDYAVTLPALPFADDQGKRYFLDSYGVVQIRPVLAGCNCNIISSYDLFAKDVTMQMPIPADRLSAAPDSIEAWHLDANSLQWVRNGWAYKKNGVFEKDIRQYGGWIFAIPRDAVYLTLQLRTTNGMALPNTRFIVRNDSNEVAEGRTNALGNALILAPSNRSLSLNVVDDHFYNYNNIQTSSQNVGSFFVGSAKKVVVLPDRGDVGTLEGSVYNCDGSSFDSGSVVVSQTNAKDDYVFPISKGRFTMANWLSPAQGGATLTFRDAAGNTAFATNTYLGSLNPRHLKRLKESFFACPDAGQLYVNYQIDNKDAVSIVGDINQAIPKLTAKPGGGSTDITLQDGTKGVTFSMWILQFPTGEITIPPPTINNIPCIYNPNGSSDLTIYRDDAVPNGIMEGWFGIDYLDANNSPHTVTGNFRVKISG